MLIGVCNLKSNNNVPMYLAFDAFFVLFLILKCLYHTGVLQAKVV